MSWSARFLALAFVGVMSVGCGDAVEPAPRFTRDEDALFQTDSLAYTVRRGDIGYEVSIGVTFTNATGMVVHFVNCLGSTSFELQKLVADQWHVVWSAVTPTCLSAPIVIAPGAGRALHLTILGGFPEGNVHPQFLVADISGEYRAVFHDVVHPDAGLPFGTTLPLASRVSNRFRLTVAPP
jgi:hypothetical protein